MTWRVETRIYGTGDERRWFVLREGDGNPDAEYVLNERGRPKPYCTEQEAEEKAAQLNDFWERFDVQR